MRRSTLTRTAAGAAVLSVAVSGCGITWDKQPKPPTRVTIDAASTLRVPFGRLSSSFENSHPGVKIVMRYGTGSDLLAKIRQGAPVGGFAGSQADMGQMVKAGEAQTPVTFASNTIEIVVPAGNPKKIATLKDLAKPGLRIAACQAGTPCAADAAKVRANAHVKLTPEAQEADGGAVASDVAAGKADAGLVYASDVKAAGTKVDGVIVPANLNVTTSYQIALLAKAKHPAAARKFVDFVASDTGKTVLASDGYGPPLS